VTTLEYGEIVSGHPQLDTLTPTEFRAAFLDWSLGRFDAIVSLSSLEHSGLGRYGDALNPWGDIIAFARGWCVTKPDALFLWSGPIETSQTRAQSSPLVEAFGAKKGPFMIGSHGGATPEGIEFNGHRVYGPIRIPDLATNWRMIELVAQHPGRRRSRSPELHRQETMAIFQRLEDRHPEISEREVTI
jgi:hypothetical protein